MQEKDRKVLATDTPVSEAWARLREIAEASIWTDLMVSALLKGVRGGRWHALIDKVYAEKTLALSYQNVRRNKGAAGVDKMRMATFDAKARTYLQELSQALRGGNYQPSDVRRSYIPKGSGEKRPLGIPTIKDRVVQGAIKMVIEPIFEKDFMPSSYGFRPKLGCKDALRRVDELIKAGNHYVVDADLRKYFDTIPHEALMNRVKEKISDGRMLELIEKYLKQGILDGLERWTPIQGTPQGAVLSPLLANIYLAPLDKLMAEANIHIVRYADDFVILCQSESRAQEALQMVRKWTEENGLTLHPDKTHIGNCMKEGQGFQFLGYRFEAGRRYVRETSVKKLKDSIRQRTRRTEGKGLAAVIKTLNRILIGWFNYFKHVSNARIFRLVDGFIRRRLRAMLRKQEKRPGFGRCLNDHRRWRNAFFAANGLFALERAHIKARCSR